MQSVYSSFIVEKIVDHRFDADVCTDGAKL